MSADDLKLDRFEYGAAFDLGYNFGEGIDSKVSDLFDGSAMDSMGAFDIGNTLDGIYGNTGDTAENTVAMSDALDITEEDLSYLRDIAEREAINRLQPLKSALICPGCRTTFLMEWIWMALYPG